MEKKIAYNGHGSRCALDGWSFGCLWRKIYKKLAEQQFIVHMVSGREIIDTIVAGEFDFSPTIFDPHVDASKKRSTSRLDSFGARLQQFRTNYVAKVFRSPPCCKAVYRL